MKIANISWSDGYLVSHNGQVFSLFQGGITRIRRRTPLLLRPWKDEDGYLHVGISNGCGKHKRFSIHRLVALTFIGEPPTPLHEVRHLDGNPAHNFYLNLAWGTDQENSNDTVRHGRSSYGERNPKAKLTPEIVAEIRDLVAAGVVKLRLSERFGVSSPQISKIALGQSWAREVTT